MAGVPVGVLLEVVLMIFLGRKKGGGCRDYFGDHRVFPLPATRHLGLDFLGDAFLFLVVIKDRAAILAADIVALAIGCCRVVHAKEETKNSRVTGFAGVECDLHGLGMARAAGLHVLVMRRRHIAAGVTHFSTDDARLLAQQLLHPPKQPPASVATSTFRSASSLPKKGRYAP